MDLLRIATAGSVDDGKSTLIGRLLFDTRSIARDRLEAVTLTSQRKGLDFTDLSLLTDGLIAEREQGITIDVAHIYFSTERRKYIIADTPGHVEYTRNMITGASNTQASLVLVDARNGVVEQTRRHLYISHLLRLPVVFVCVNKMDLVGFDESVFLQLQQDIQLLADKIGFSGQLHFIPMAAKGGDNVVDRSDAMPWYKGDSLLGYLEELPVRQHDRELDARFPVQFVIRPHSDSHPDFRGYAGRLVSGALKTGDQLTVLPSLKSSRILAIILGGQPVNNAAAGDSITLELEDDVDVSRGNMLVASHSSFSQIQQFGATICWLDEQGLVPGKTYLLQHGVHTVKARVSLQSVIDMETMESRQQEIFGLNAIGTARIKTASPIFADPFAVNPSNGAFILIDEFSNATVAVGLVEAE
jgi:sulfate adenylyltransferase subunit 1